MTPKQIKTLRKKLGLTQHELASILGISERMMRYWETDTGKPNWCPRPGDIMLMKSLKG